MGSCTSFSSGPTTGGLRSENLGMLGHPPIKGLALLMHFIIRGNPFLGMLGLFLDGGGPPVDGRPARQTGPTDVPARGSRKGVCKCSGIGFGWFWCGCFVSGGRGQWQFFELQHAKRHGFIYNANVKGLPLPVMSWSSMVLVFHQWATSFLCGAKRRAVASRNFRVVREAQSLPHVPSGTSEVNIS